MEKRKVIRKICLLGDGGVGKTSLIGRYVYDCFSDEYIVSFGTKVSKKVIEFEDVQLTLMIWDILGQKAQKSLHAAYYNGANGALVVCDSSRQETLEHLPAWKNDFRQVVGDRPIIPIANKSDMPNGIRLDVLAEVSKELGHEFLFTSAKSGKGVEDAFLEMGRRVLEVGG